MTFTKTHVLRISPTPTIGDLDHIEREKAKLEEAGYGLTEETASLMTYTLTLTKDDRIQELENRREKLKNQAHDNSRLRHYDPAEADAVADEIEEEQNALETELETLTGG